MGRILLLSTICCAVGLASPPVVHGADPTDQECVGEWGRVDRISIDGARAYSTEMIRLATRRDIESIAASRPGAALDEYPKMLAERIRAGYIAAGFLDAQVGGTVDRQREMVVISIVEGIQYLCGPIEIEGGEGIDADRLRDWITSEHPPADAWLAGFDEADGRSEPRWVSNDGSPAEFDKPAWQRGTSNGVGNNDVLEKVVRQGLADQGYRFAKFTVDADPQESVLELPLRIKIDDLGPLATIDRIEVTGSDRDTPNEVRAYLGIEPGDVYTTLVNARLWHKLWASGRYLHHAIEVMEVATDERPIRLDINLVDYAPATALRDALNPAEQTLLKFRNWIQNAGRRGDDLLLRFRNQDAEYELIYAEKRGVLGLLRPVAAVGGTSTAPNEMKEFAFLARPGEIAILHEPWQKRFQATLHDHRLTLNVYLRPDPKPQPEGKQFTMQLGLGFKHVELDEDDAPFRLAMDLSPTAILSLAHSRERECTIADDVLTIQKGGKKERLRIDAGTGRLLEWSINGAFGDETEMTLVVEQGAFERRVSAVERQLPRALAELPNDYDPQQFLGTLTKTLLESPLPDYLLHSFHVNETKLAQLDGIRHALAKLCGAGVLRPVDDLGLFNSNAPDLGPSFEIPLSERSVRGIRINSMLGANAYLLAYLCDKVFPHGSWAWTMWRDLILANFGHDALAEDLRPLTSSRQVGPLMTLCLVNFPGMPASWIANVTKHALDHTAPKDFAYDYEPLLAPGTLVGDLAYQMAAALRDLTDEEIAPLDSMIFGTEREVLVSAARTLRERREEDLQDLIPVVLNQIWNAGLREPIQILLRDLYVDNMLLARQSNVTKPAKDSDAKPGELPEQPSLVPRSPDAVMRISK